MPTVPEAPISRVEQKPLGTPYDAGAGVSKQAFGADASGAIALGTAMNKIGDSLDAAAIRLQERDDAVDRAKIYSGFKRDNSERLRVLSTTADVGDVSVQKTYQAEVAKDLKDRLDSHQGSESSKARLAARLYELQGSLVDHANNVGFSEKVKRVDRVVKDQATEWTAQAEASPRELANIHIGIQNFLDDMDPGMSPGDRHDYEKYLMGSALTGAITGVLNRGGSVDEAVGILYNTPGANQWITPEQRFHLQSRIRAAEERQLKGKKFGVAPAGASVFDEDTGKIVATAPDKNKPMFGSSYVGLLQDQLFQLEAEYDKNGGFTPEQSRLHESVARQVVDGVPNAITGIREGGIISSKTADILKAGGVDVPPEAISKVKGKPGAQKPAGGSAPKPEGEAPVEEPPVIKESTVGKASTWLRKTPLIALADDFAGPIANIERVFGKTPFVEGGSKAESSERVIVTMLNGMASDLQKNPRFAEGEWKRLFEGLNISPSLWNNATAIRKSLVDLDRILEEKLAASKDVLARETSGDRRKAEYDTVAILTAARQIVAPNRVDNPEQAAAFKAANPDGGFYTKEKAPGVWSLFWYRGENNDKPQPKR